MNNRISEFLITLTKASEIRNFLRKAFQNNLPLKPVLGLTGLAVVFIACRPLFTGLGGSKKPERIEEPEKKTAKSMRQEALLLMQQKENEFRKRDMERKAQESQ